jgi:probable F420-dependent oxidoreductase
VGRVAPADRPIRFATQLNSVASRHELVARAREAEARGFSAITVADHFRPGDLAPLVAMTAMADATTSIHVGSNVLGNDYRHPVVLARELATLDLVSEGRLQVGIGAGWLRSDYDIWGVPMDPPAVRVARLAESIAVLKALWSGDPCTFRGDHYSVHAPAGVAPSRQRPHPPLLVGAGGRRMLELAGREADIVGITFNQRHGAPDARSIMADAGNADEDVHDRRIAWIRAAAGARFDAIELAVFAIVRVTDDRDAAIEAMAAAHGVSPTWVAAAPQFYFGSIGEIADDMLAARARYGITYFMTPGEDLEVASQLVERLAGR